MLQHDADDRSTGDPETSSTAAPGEHDGPTGSHVGRGNGGVTPTDGMGQPASVVRGGPQADAGREVACGRVVKRERVRNPHHTGDGRRSAISANGPAVHGGDAYVERGT